MDTLKFDLELDMCLGEYDEAVAIMQLAALYGINASLISLQASACLCPR